MSSDNETAAAPNASAPKVDEVAKLTVELAKAKAENEGLRRTCAALETTVRVLTKLVP